MSLNDGKLLVKREAKLKETVGTFRIGKSTSVEVLDNYACFAIALDKKEVIIMTSAAVRSNWLVAIRSAIQKLPPLARGITASNAKLFLNKILDNLGAKYEEIDFGAPQRPTMRSMHLKKADLGIYTLRSAQSKQKKNFFFQPRTPHSKKTKMPILAASFTPLWGRLAFLARSVFAKSMSQKEE